MMMMIMMMLMMMMAYRHFDLNRKYTNKSIFNNRIGLTYDQCIDFPELAQYCQYCKHSCLRNREKVCESNCLVKAGTSNAGGKKAL